MVGIRYLLLVILMLSSWPLQAAQLSATVDRNVATLGEPVLLTLSLSDSDERLRAEGVNPNIDLTVLHKDFDVGVPTVENTYNIYQGRGRSLSRLKVEVFAKRTGTMMIPSFSAFGLQTLPLKLTINARKAEQAPEVLVRSGLSKPQIWPHEQVIVYLDLYHRVPLASASMGEDLSSEPLKIDLLEHRKLPGAQRQERYHGVLYEVSRTAWAVFPHQAGDLTLFVPDVWIETRAGRKLRFPHQALALRVQALPADAAPTILIGPPELSQSPVDPLPDLNSFTTWQITLRSRSALTTLPPSLTLNTTSNDYKLYFARAQLSTADSTTGTQYRMDYTLSITPLRAGEFTLPQIRWPYLEPATGAIHYAELPLQKLKVVAAPAAQREEQEPRAQTTAPATITAAPEDSAPTLLYWQISTIVLASAWLLTLILMWHRRRPPKNTPPPAATPTSTAATQQPLQALLLAAFHAPSLQQGLDQWERRYGIDPQLRNTVQRVQQLYYGPHKSAPSAELQAEVNQAVTLIHAQQNNPTITDDPWLPQAFTHRIK